MSASHKVGDLVRVKRGVRKRYIDHTFTVRRVRESEVVLDDGNPSDDDHSTNGAAVMIVLPFGSVEPWGDKPLDLCYSARLGQKIQAAQNKADAYKHARDTMTGKLQQILALWNESPAPQEVQELKKAIQSAIHYGMTMEEMGS